MLAVVGHGGFQRIDGFQELVRGLDRFRDGHLVQLRRPSGFDSKIVTDEVFGFEFLARVNASDFEIRPKIDPRVEFFSGIIGRTCRVSGGDKLVELVIEVDGPLTRIDPRIVGCSVVLVLCLLIVGLGFSCSGCFQRLEEFSLTLGTILGLGCPWRSGSGGTKLDRNGERDRPANGLFWIRHQLIPSV